MESMLNWREIPFVRLLFPFLLGIGLALYFDTPIGYLPFFLFFFFGLLLFLALAKIRFNLRWFYGFSISIFLIGFGYQITSVKNELRNPNHFQKFIGQEDIILVQVTDSPKSGKKIRVKGQIKGINNNGEWISTNGNILMYLETSADFADLRYGDQLMVKARVQPIPIPKNPEAFDFKKYQFFQNTHYQLFAKQHLWSIVERDQGLWLLSQAFLIRNHFLSVLKKHLPTKEEYGVAAALILGNKSALTPEVQMAYSSTGATHVLAVSGLHVGFIYMGLAMILRLFRRRGKLWKIFKTLVLIVGVWAFAFITGAPPSVLRAATMFSFIILGRTLDRSTNIYNTLALSAFCLLCYNPYLLAEVGFQLSYLAILGIVSFQSWIYRLWIIDHPIGDYIWKLISVSLAAQITTFPITIFYFHQFPFYFWLSGLVVVPAAMFILGGGLLLFFIDISIPFLAPAIGWLLYKLIWIVNALIYFIQQLPAALIQGLWIGVGGMLLLYLSILVLTYIFVKGKRYRAVGIAACLATLLLANAIQNHSRMEQKEMVLYHVYQNSLIDLVKGRRISSIQSKDLEQKATNFAAQNQRWKSGLKDHRIVLFDSPEVTDQYFWYKNGFLQFFDNRIAFINKGFVAPKNKQVNVDYLVLRNNPKIKVESLTQTFPNATWVADGSNAPWTVASWQQLCEAKGIDFKNLTEIGGQIIKLK